ncbi:armadillo-type protein [Mycena epipterygia]|nr:armadillo-type protein [Mycena epipterygia]
MALLRRWPTRESIHSWWSDSNSLGATIPLHTLSKPLLKYLYHRQALGIMTPSPLTAAKVDLLTTYLDFKDISSSTRVLVLDHLRVRAWESQFEAEIIIDGDVLAFVNRLLQSSDLDVVLFTCGMLRSIAYYDSLQTAVLKPDPCMQLVSLLSHKNSRIQEEAVNVLACISSGPAEGPRAVVNADALSHSTTLLASTNFGIRLHICWMLGNIARHPAFTVDVLELDVCARLVSLLAPANWHISRGTRREVRWASCSACDFSLMQRNVVYALACISAGSEHGARAVVNAHALDHFSQLLQSPNPDVVRLTCWLLATIARHASLNSAVLELNPLTPLVLLMHVRQEAGYAVRCIVAGGKEQEPDAGHRSLRIFGAAIDRAGFWSRVPYVPRPWTKTLGSVNPSISFRLPLGATPLQDDFPRSI